MNRLIAVLLMILLVVAAAVFILWDRTPSVRDSDRQLSEQFMDCLSLELSPPERQEIAGILDRFFEMAVRGAVEPEDIRSVRQEMKNHIMVGLINQVDLAHFMARVSYLTYKSNPDANLPEGVIDHPVLNPDSS